MFVVTIRNDLNVTTIHDQRYNDINLPVIFGNVKQGEPNTIDTFTFKIYPNNPGYNLIYPLKTLIRVQNVNIVTNEITNIFLGRVLKQSMGMDDKGNYYKKYICESSMSFLLDSIQEYKIIENMTLVDFVNSLITNHNSQVEEYKKINVKIDDPVSKFNINTILTYGTTYDTLINEVMDFYGIEMVATSKNWDTFLEIKNHCGYDSYTKFEVGVNIMSLSVDIDPSNYVTRLYPYGAKKLDKDGNETEERVTIASDITYIQDDEAVKVYGILSGIAIFDDIDDPKMLAFKGHSALSRQQLTPLNKISVIDLSLIDGNYDPIFNYWVYELSCKDLGISYRVRVTSKDININSPEKTTITLGDTNSILRLSNYQKNSIKIAEKVNKLESKYDIIKKRIDQLNKR